MKVSQAETPDVPAALLTAVVAVHERLSTVRLFTRRPNSSSFDVTVCVLTLHGADESPVKVGNPPTDTASDIVAELVKRARAWTTENGDTQFQAQLCKCVGERGPEPKPQLVAFDTRGGIASPDANPEADLYVRIAEGLWKQHLALLEKTTALATAQVVIIQALAAAHSNILDRERAVATSNTDAEIARLAASIERDRMTMLNKSLSPVLLALQKKLGVGPGATTATTSTSAGEKVEALARQARSLAGSLSGPQWDVARAKLSSRAVDALDRMRNVATDGDTMHAVADLISEPVELLLEVYSALDGKQQGELEALQTAVADASEKSTAAGDGTPSASQ